MPLARKQDETPISGEELFRRPDLGSCELVRGRVVAMTPTGYVHGGIELALGAALREYARATGRGRAMVGEVGIFVSRDPDTVRAADALFISTARYAARKSSGYLDVAPELVVEILSPDDRWSDVMAKLEDYLSAGVDRVWVIDPRLRKVFDYRSLTEVGQRGEGEILRDEELLPGFAFAVADLFRDA